MHLNMELVEAINAVIWHRTVLFVLLGVGILFTIWSTFGQYRALTHGVQVIRGKYDDKSDPGAINHFQALSTALSATVGLGNIAGVAIAISVGGPGSVFWMWVTGLVGMCLKMTEVTQAMLFRNIEDPKNPHGGAMWVCRKGFGTIAPWLRPVGVVIGGVFCITLLVSTITGGNMFQAWNVADISFEYFGIPRFVTGLILTLGVGIVIVGGIKRIGEVAGRVVPLMCGIYILAGLYVVVVNADQIPSLFMLILREAFAPSEAVGAFIGGTAGYGFLKGMQRALFSNEAGQGSAPIAHSAARTDEPAREGIVAGLEPFVDTICVCTITALVILLSGTWNREPSLAYDGDTPRLTQVLDAVGQPARDAKGNLRWSIAALPVRVRDEVEARTQLRPGKEVVLIVEAGPNPETGMNRHRVTGVLKRNGTNGWMAEFPEFRSQHDVQPGIVGSGVYFDFKGATLTAKAFDRALPGLGFWIVPATVWLFAFSTMISWSYYGEQGVVYLLGNRMIMVYRVIYCLLILVTVELVRSQRELDVLSTLGTGVMLWANIPIMLLFGPMAMRTYHDYFRRMKVEGSPMTDTKPPW